MGSLEIVPRSDTSIGKASTCSTDCGGQHFQIWNVLVSFFMTRPAEESVNEARRELFCQKNRTMETIPPTQDALLQHTIAKRVAYQAGIWTTSNLSLQQSPSLVGLWINKVVHGFQCSMDHATSGFKSMH